MENNANGYRVGFVQFPVKSGKPAVNLASLKRALARLAPEGPGLIVLPELWSCGFVREGIGACALQTIELLNEMQKMAGRYGIHLAGSLPEAVLAGAVTTFHNTLYVVGPEGICGHYRKQQLFGPIGEDVYFVAGDDPQPVETALGPIGALVCYDLRFPELARHQAACGAELLAVSAQWPMERLAHWKTLLAARAIENQLFVIACNTCGFEGKTQFAGHSLIIGPDGSSIFEAGADEEEVLVDIDRRLIAGVRQRFCTTGVSPYRHYDQDKIVDLASLVKIVARCRAMGRQVVFTNGCFDILHQGHVTYLEAARREGDLLIVGINSDSSVRSLGKGDDRPVNGEQSRARVLAALGCVDFVVIFPEETPQVLISALRPEVLVKGGDWPVEKIVGAPEVLAAGGRVLSIPLVDDFSTTGLICRIRSA